MHLEHDEATPQSNHATPMLNDDITCHPCYADLNFARTLRRAAPVFPKVIIATNVAETSSTIDGVKFVVNYGMENMLLISGKS